MTLTAEELEVSTQYKLYKVIDKYDFLETDSQKLEIEKKTLLLRNRINMYNTAQDKVKKIETYEKYRDIHKDMHKAELFYKDIHKKKEYTQKEQDDILFKNIYTYDNPTDAQLIKNYTLNINFDTEKIKAYHVFINNYKLSEKIKLEADKLKYPHSFQCTKIKK